MIRGNEIDLSNIGLLCCVELCFGVEYISKCCCDFILCLCVFDRKEGEKLIARILYIVICVPFIALVAWGFMGAAFDDLRGISMDNVIVFIELSVLCLGVWTFMAHISTYLELKPKIKPEHLQGFNFATYTASEVKRYFTGKGLF